MAWQAERVADTVIEFNSLTHIEVNAHGGIDDDGDIYDDELQMFLSEAGEASQEASRVVTDVQSQLAEQVQGSPHLRGDGLSRSSPQQRSNALQVPTASPQPISLASPVAVVIEGDESKDESLL